MLDQIISRIHLQSATPKTILIPGGVNPGLMKRGLAIKTGRIANVSIEWMTSYVVERAAQHLPGKSYVGGDRLFYVVGSLLKSLKPALKYFGASVGFDGLIHLMVTTIRELRLNGIQASDLQKLPMREKWSDVLTVMERYELLKKGRALFDYADAVEELSVHPSPMPTVFLVDHEMTPFERHLAAAVGWSMISPDASAKEARYQISGYRVDTQYQEALQTVRNLMSDIVGSQTPVKIGICVPDYDASVYLFRPILEKAGNPDLIHFIRGEPVFSTGPGRLWKYFNEWASNNFSVYRLLRILSSPDLDREGTVGGKVKTETYYRALDCFRDAGLVLFNRDFPSAFKNFLDEETGGEQEHEAERNDQEAARCALSIASKFSAIHKGKVGRDQLVTFAELFSDCARRTGPNDNLVLVKIQKNVEEILAEMPEDLSLRDALAATTNNLGSRYVSAALPDFNRPILGTLEDLRYLDFDRLYILGLNEHGLPRNVVQNPLLLDFEKEELMHLRRDAHFSLMEDLLRHDETIFYSFTTHVTQSIVLSAPLKDLTTGRELLVSRYMLDLWNMRNDAHEDYRSMAGILARDSRSQNNYVSGEAADSFYDYETALSVVTGQGAPPLEETFLNEFFPFAGEAIESRKRRVRGTGFDEYWGAIDLNIKELPVFSASRLITYARCPHQYFLQHMLHLDAPEDYDPASLVWLQPMDYGSLLHTVYFRFFTRMRELKGIDFTGLEESDRAVFREEFEKTVTEFVISRPPNSPLHFNYQLHSLRKDVEGFFDRELGNGNARMFFELSFNMPDLHRRDQITRRQEPAEIVLTDKSRILVRGSIDRVERTNDGRYILIDYKTGKARDIDPASPFDGGKLMQAGLYSEVARQIDGRISSPLFRYYYSTAAAGFKDYLIDYSQQRKHFISLLTAIIHEIRSGNFVPVGTDVERSPCSYCDFVNVCMRGKSALASRLRQLDPHLAKLESLQKEEVDG